jgi:hypothetical protein
MNMNPNGSVVATGDQKGTVYLIELSDHFLALDKIEKLTIVSVSYSSNKTVVYIPPISPNTSVRPV